MQAGDGRPECTFGVLGSLTVTVDRSPVTLGAAKTRIVLACLLLRRGAVVPTDELVDRLWGENPPPGARNAVHTYVRRLRGALGAAGRLIQTEPAGYVIEVPADALDSDQFRGHMARARSAADAGDTATESRELRAGLALWRGAPLSDVPSELLHRSEVPRLVEERLQALERRIAIDLAAGRHAELVPELRNLTAEHPLRERLWYQLMLALYRSHRQAEALAAFREVRTILREELGVDPCQDLAELHHQVLSGGPSPVEREPTASGGWTPAFQLPPEVVDFVGREDLIERIKALVVPEEPARRGVPVVTLSGPPGVGKTELAVRVAHIIRPHFPDGQLFVNLRGYAQSPPVRPVEALSRFLRALGIRPERIPLDLDEQSALFRSTLADRRVLLVLDNAVGPDQVRPLLPGNATCAVIVTSRDNLHGLSAVNGAHRVPVDVVTEGEATAILSAIIGADRAAGESAAISALAATCGFLPLALRIAASNLAAMPGQPIASYVRDLWSADRVAALAIDSDDQAAVRLAFDRSYDALQPASARLFRLLGLVPGADFDQYAAANLAGVGLAAAQRSLGALATANLVRQHRPGRYQFHDLIRDYARGRARSEAEAEVPAAVRRLFDFYLYATDAAARYLYPDQARLPKPEPSSGVDLPTWDGPIDALGWLDTEATNLVATACDETLQEAGAPVWLLADALLGYIVRQRHDAAWLTMFSSAVAAAERAGDVPATAALQRGLGRLHFQRNEYPEARERYLRSVALFRQLGDLNGEGRDLSGLGAVASEMQEDDEAVRCFQEAVRLLRANGDRAGEATALFNLGNSMMILTGRTDEGVGYLTEAKAIATDLGLRHIKPHAAAGVALSLSWRGQLDAAVEEFEKVLPQWVELGYTEGRSEALRNLAEVHLEAGRTDEAIALAEQALTLAEQVGVAWTVMGARVILGQAYLQSGDVEAAQRQLSAARDLAVAGRGYWYALVLLGLAACHRRRGDHRSAAELAEQVAGTTRPRQRARAHAELALSALDRADHESAARHAELARDIAGEHGYRLDEERARVILLRARQGLAAAAAPGRGN
jgi:DNA-binding SARP family transcriptional activator